MGVCIDVPAKRGRSQDTARQARRRMRVRKIVMVVLHSQSDCVILLSHRGVSVETTDQGAWVGKTKEFEYNNL